MSSKRTINTYFISQNSKKSKKSDDEKYEHDQASSSSSNFNSEDLNRLLLLTK